MIVDIIVGAKTTPLTDSEILNEGTEFINWAREWSRNCKVSNIADYGDRCTGSYL